MRTKFALLALPAIALFSACSHVEDDMDSVSDPAEVAALTVNVLDCGTIGIGDLDGFSSAGDYAGQTDVFTDSCFLVRHPEGMLLWDLGVPGMLAGTDGMQNGVFDVSLGSTLTSQIQALGLSMDDVDYVSISHSHFDHIGQAPQVTQATWLVHEAEAEHMFPADGSAPKVAADQAAMFQAFSGLEKQTFSGEHDVFGDGSVVIVPTPGHTPGHTSLQLIMPESGPILLTGDLYHRKESRSLKRVPRFNFDERATLQSMAAFEARAEAMGAKIIIQHEPDDITPLGGVIR
ncbi:MAG: N-acyl homoserine lactonase family protein [Hyphomonas sp.]